jgi:hypothetical protein
MQALRLLLLLVSTVVIGGCELIGDIFQAGMFVGVVLVLLIIGGIMFLLRKIRR